MISPIEPDDVLAGLGDKFLVGFAGAVVSARSDLADMRAWRPGWFPTMHSRCLSNLIHDRIWAHLVAAVESDPDAVVHDSGPTRQIQVGTNYLLRIKRHRRGNRISTYPTQTALQFWLQDDDQTFDGLELITLAAGYRWDEDLREVKAPVLSYRDGKDNPLWAVELDEPAAGATSLRWNSIIPDLPSLDFGELGEDDETGDSSGS